MNKSFLCRYSRKRNSYARKQRQRRQICSSLAFFLILAFSNNYYPSCDALSPPPPPLIAFASSGASLWLARAASASLTYVGLVVGLDRPRGQVNVDCLRVAQSQVKGAGLGLYCTANMAKDTVLGTYPGVVLPLEQNLRKLKEYPACEAYVWRFSDNAMVIDPTNSKGEIEPMTRGGNPSSFGSTWLMEHLVGKFVQVPTTLCRINEPPPGSSVNVVTDEDTANRKVVFSLCRDVYEGEELFMDYGVTYDRSGYTNHQR